MDKRYDPKRIEAAWYDFWLKKGQFHGEAAQGGEPYCVVIPPPNVTGILHMGHALNNTLQDILVRWRKMQGRNVVWMPGTDHAGIATQNVVERALRKEGIHREQLGREAFVERVWQWREEYGGTIIRQLKRLGCACDWERERFTMDAGLSEAVQEAFVRLFDKGLVYRGNYIVNWCPRCHTALSDEESEHRELDGKLYYIRYPVENAGAGTTHIVVATTRPETLLGDVAVAINPRDERYRGLKGSRVRLPILGRELAVIEDDFVDPAFGTGIVKVTPAHDPNDFDMGRRHGLEPIDVMHGDGRMNDLAGPYAGLDRFECRKRILVDLTEAGLVEKIVDHKHAVGHCYRCHTVVEPRLCPQWFVRMKPLAAPAIEAVKDGRVAFVPSRWTKVYLDWMENIRDWCISRQIWWGHRIPVFTCEACGHEWAARGTPAACPKCGDAKLKQDEDVLDTWFSSWLWPFSTFGWPARNEDLKFYYPTHDLTTASEIIFFWVARMIMAGFEFMGDIPFRTVYIHGTVRDEQGRKMSKSLGNSIDPIGIIEEFSADSLRFSLMMIAATGQDVYLSNDKFEIGRNFGTKLWNAARFILMHAEKAGGERTECRADLATPDDAHIVARLRQAVNECTESLERYRFNDAARTLYEFVWGQFCDRYLESAKDALYGADDARRLHTLGVLREVFSAVLRLLHPMMPFITEELWHAMSYGADDESIMTAPWPTELTGLSGIVTDPAVVRYVEDKHELIRLGRSLKADYGIATTVETDYLFHPGSEDAAARVTADVASLKIALKAAKLDVATDARPTRGMASAVCALGTVAMRLEGVIDIDAERKRLLTQLAKIVADQENCNRKLANHEFVTRAPAGIVERQRASSREIEEKRRKLEHTLAALPQA
jgi:valyl-tRNA synthetase